MRNSTNSSLQDENNTELNIKDDFVLVDKEDIIIYQKEIDNLMLINNRKFIIKTYCLLSGNMDESGDISKIVNNVLLNIEGIMFCASEDYDKTSTNRKEAFTAILKYMKDNDIHQLIGETEIFIFPGYDFKVCDGLITNFHQPGSTLIMLVAALVGDDWRKMYDHALDNDYRFLSYGDSSLLMKKV